MAALHLARAGRSVVVLEQASYPRDKVCGDALIPDSIRVLARAGLLQNVQERALETTTLRLFSASQTELVIPLHALVIKRVVLDHMLIAAAAEAGATVTQAHVVKVEEGRLARVTMRGVEKSLKSRIAVIATGADIRLLTSLDMVQCADPSIVAVRRYVKSTANIHQLIISFDRAIAPGYVWLFPIGGGEYNVGCGIVWGSRRIDLAAYLDRVIREFPPFRLFAAGITGQEPIRGARLRCGLTGTVAWQPPNILAIGESIGTTFHLTGEGIGKAMETGERAAAVVLRALDAGDPSILATFQHEIDALRRHYRGYELAQRWIARPWVGNVVARLARRSRRAMACAESVLNESADPRDIFSLRGIWNMLRS
jgi:flavin-dependent dehydrogenase